ncbi:hypothetical protein GIS00_12545 [Nakamurella sp. YIM 132087]|uniref:Uncharacterized protein n=1 Tax=Nakamurella alba TaxID=2665158 RepID=A0A7K1FN75_9ACTN|nr:hypothetical protein [Nakamurella alba]MTD14769.1 hypothetical protein [Nakamurella alba]
MDEPDLHPDLIARTMSEHDSDLGAADLATLRRTVVGSRAARRRRLLTPLLAAAAVTVLLAGGLTLLLSTRSDGPATSPPSTTATTDPTPGSTSATSSPLPVMLQKVSDACGHPLDRLPTSAGQGIRATVSEEGAGYSTVTLLNDAMTTVSQVGWESAILGLVDRSGTVIGYSTSTLDYGATPADLLPGKSLEALLYPAASTACGLTTPAPPGSYTVFPFVKINGVLYAGTAFPALLDGAGAISFGKLGLSGSNGACGLAAADLPALGAAGIAASVNPGAGGRPEVQLMNLAEPSAAVVVSVGAGIVLLDGSGTVVARSSGRTPGDPEVRLDTSRSVVLETSADLSDLDWCSPKNGSADRIDESWRIAGVVGTGLGVKFTDRAPFGLAGGSIYTGEPAAAACGRSVASWPTLIGVGVQSEVVGVVQHVLQYSLFNRSAVTVPGVIGSSTSVAVLDTSGTVVAVLTGTPVVGEPGTDLPRGGYRVLGSVRTTGVTLCGSADLVPVGTYRVVGLVQAAGADRTTVVTGATVTAPGSVTFDIIEMVPAAGPGG